jgi:N-acetyl-gamma-glutamyl-phosphate reductase
MALLPVIRASQIEPHDIIIDAKSGISGAGRSLKLGTMFTEAGEGLSPYAIAAHRHAPEIEQELSSACGEDVIVNFTPHLVPMSRGELITAYVRLINGAGPDDLRQNLQEFYADKPFVQVLEPGIMPATQHVRGSNYCLVSVFEDRIKDRAIIVAAIDNLVKGSAGQALQNFNIMHGLAETTGLQQLPLFP